MLGQIISGTRCDRDKPFFLQKRGVNKIELGYENVKRGKSWGSSHTFKYPPPSNDHMQQCSSVSSTIKHHPAIIWSDRRHFYVGMRAILSDAILSLMLLVSGSLVEMPLCLASTSINNLVSHEGRPI